MYVLLFGSLFGMSLCLPSVNYLEETEWLERNGFGHLSENFKSEEVEIHHILTLDNNSLRELGVTTIGARCRIRESAQEWVNNNTGVGQQQPDQQQPDQQQQDQQQQDQQQQQQGEEIEDEGEVQEDGRGIRDETRINDTRADPIIFIETKSKTGKIYHSFLNGFYRFYRRNVRKSGRAHFHCSVAGCRAG